MNRKLSVKKERLTELTPAELVVVAGGAPQTYYSCLCNSEMYCTTAISCGCPITYPLSERVCTGGTD